MPSRPIFINWLTWFFFSLCYVFALGLGRVWLFVCLIFIEYVFNFLFIIRKTLTQLSACIKYNGQQRVVIYDPRTSLSLCWMKAVYSGSWTRLLPRCRMHPQLLKPKRNAWCLLDHLLVCKLVLLALYQSCSNLLLCHFLHFFLTHPK